MTVTQLDHDEIRKEKKQWGPTRNIVINRSPSNSLGLSIVGGTVDVYNTITGKNDNICGIFIKNITPDSPAGRTEKLKTGDRIIEVDGVNVENSTHEHAVNLIQNAGDAVRFVVQSLEVPGVSHGMRRQTTENHTDDNNFANQNDVQLNRAGNSRRSVTRSIRKKAAPLPSDPKTLAQVSEDKENDRPNASESISKSKFSSESSSEDEDTRHLEGNVYTKAGKEISRKSAGNVKRSKEEIEADKEEEDEFGYTKCKVQKKYHGLKHPVTMIAIEKDRRGLGILLSGHKDRSKMAAMICGLNPSGMAYKTGGLAVGDEILEVNGHVLQNRCHLNASSIIKGIPGTVFKIIVVRRKSGVGDLAVAPITQFLPTLDDEDQFSEYKGVHAVSVKKGQYGLGIMIIEGKHAEVGQGIFVSDIQEGSAAEQAGLQVGELILAVNSDHLLGATYDEATNLLKKTEGVVTLTVCNPNQSKVAQEEEEKAANQGNSSDPSTDRDPAAVVAAAEPEKPKEPEAPHDPKTGKIPVGRDTPIEFTKEKQEAIGLTVIGGSDSPLIGVFVLDVYANTAAGKDGRLQPGDHIIEFCKEPFKSIQLKDARAAVLKASGSIHMIVFRQLKGHEEVEVELQQKAGKGIGLCLTGFNSGSGAYISDLIAGCSAIDSGKLVLGDVITAISGEDVRQMPVEDIALLLKISNPLQLKVTRYKSIKT